MDDHLNPTILGNFANNCENMEVRKPNAQSVLKGVENGNLQFMNMQDREQEFIDHTLLAPEYISNTISNSFIIDLMDQQGQPAPDCPINSLNPNDSFSTDAQLHTILQFVNRQGQIRTQTNISAESSSDHLINHTDKEMFESEFLAMHGNLLNEQNFKIFCGQQSISTQEALNQDLNVATLPSLPVQNAPLTPIRWLKKERYEEPLEQIPDLMGPLGAKKILPHKKRISKKLKTLEKSEFLYQLDEESPVRNERLAVSNGSQFECEICGAVSESQVQFFSHLKGHYEPSAAEDPKCATETIHSSSITVPDDNSVIEKAQSSHTTVVGGHQVFNEVELNFDSFNEVVELTTQHQNVPVTEPDHHADMKILNSNVIAKCMEYVAQQDTTQACSVHDEVEFSDTEDMLEGLRGVVDKVSVDDTSDDLDMPPPSVSKEPWFANSAFSGLNFKEEPISNESFQRVSDLIPMQPEQSSPQKENNETKSEESSPPAEDPTDDFTPDHPDDASSEDLSEQQVRGSNDFPEKRKRGRPKGSKKKKSAAESKAEDDDSSIEMENSNRRRYICLKCNREFNSCNALKYHDLSHTGERPHQCEVCEKKFFAQSALKSHLRVHTGDKPYECDKCHRKFRQWSDLKYHIVSIHSDEKNYQCEFCGKSFSRKYSLVIHRRIHTSERNYKCEFCPKSFRASSYLQNHRKIHTGEKPHECKVCGKKFRVSGDLRRHYRTHERNAKTSNEPKAPNNSNSIAVKPTTDLVDVKTDMLIKMEYEKNNKNEMLFLDKVATKIDNLFKTEETFVNASIENNDLTFVT